MDTANVSIEGPFGGSSMYDGCYVEFAVCAKTDDGFVTCHNPTSCKDFIHDAMSRVFLGGCTNIYSFVFDPESLTPIAKDKIMLLVTRLEDDEAECSASMMDAFGYGETAVYRSKHGHVFVGAERWISSPAAVSLFGTLARMGKVCSCDGTIDGLKESLSRLSGDSPDECYIRMMTSPVDVMVNMLKDDDILWERGGYAELGSQELHHGCGWLAYALGMYKVASGDGSFSDPIHEEDDCEEDECEEDE